MGDRNLTSSLSHSSAVTAANAAAAAAIGSLTAASITANHSLVVEHANNLRLFSVYDRISHTLSSGARYEASEQIRNYFSLAKGIDCALTINDIPGIAPHLPQLIKKIYESKKNAPLLSAIMMILISMKNACKKGWFRSVDSEEILSMADELFGKYCTELSPNTHVSNAFDTISKIMPRFYPGMMLCSLIVSFEAKPGYEVLMSDFHFPKNQPSDQNIVLFVVKPENLDTSSCIAGPPQVSFLVNGKGVEKRNNVSPDHGPQFPTDISKLLKYGINVLQTIGYFDGTYLIAVAYVSKISNFTHSVMKDYVQPVVAALESDSEIIEGPSRIQLSCPISFKRMKTPVKGHLCKHHQCFDYDNFLEMNLRKPNWRCPHCNQPVCILDLRIDRNMVKILEESGEDVAEVVIHADGSWNVVVEQGISADHNITQIHDQSHSMETEINRSKVSIPDIVDLTMGEDDTCDITQNLRQASSLDGYANQNGNLMMETEDRKPFIDAGGIPPLLYTNPLLVNHNSSAPQMQVYPLGNSIHPTFMPSYASNGSVASGSAHMLNMVGNFGLLDAVSTGHDQTQLSGHGLPAMRYETDSIRSMARPVDRIPVAVQALAVPSQTHSTSRRMHPNLSPRHYLTVNPSTTNPENFNGGIGNMDMQQVTRTAADTLGVQDYTQQNSPYLPNNEGSLQHMVGLPSTGALNNRSPAGHRRGLSDLDSLRSLIQPSPFSRHSVAPPPGFRHHPMNQPAMAPSQSPAPPPAARPASQNAFAGNFPIHNSLIQSPLPPHLLRGQPMPAANSPTARDNARVLGAERWRSMTSGVPSPLSRADSLPELPSDWRPTGRMRGSLTGSDYSAVIRNYMPPSNQSAAARAPLSSQPPSAADQISGLIANNFMTHQANFSQDNLGSQQGGARI